MQQYKLKRISLLFSSLALALALSLIPSQLVLAASDTIYFDPVTKTVAPNSTFTINVRGNIQGDYFWGPTSVQGIVRFPKSLLRVTTVSTTGATFNWQVSATPDNNNGYIHFNERSLSSVPKGPVFIMTITFQTLTNGTANVGFTASTAYGGQYPGSIPLLSGASYIIASPPPSSCPAGQVGTPPNCTTPPPATCPVGQVGTPPNCTTPSVPTTPNVPTTTNTPPNPSPGETAAPTIIPSTENDKGLSISDTSTSRSYKTATLSWKTSAASKNTVTYGTSLKKLDKTAEANKLPDGTYEAKLSGLTPGKQYYFTIAATSETDGSKTDSYSGLFTTKGFPVVINVTASGTPVANAKVKIGEQTYSTDKSGQLNLELASGSYDVSITSSKGSKNGTVAVAAKPLADTGKAPDVQKFSFELPAAAKESGGLSLFTIIGAVVGGIALLGLIGGLFVAIRRRREQNDGTLENPLTVDNNYNWNEAQPLPAFPQEQVTVGTQATNEEIAYTDSSLGMMPPEVPLAPVEEIATTDTMNNSDTASNQFEQPPAAEFNGDAYPPQDSPQQEAPIQSVPTEGSEFTQDPTDGANEQELTTPPPPPPAPDVAIEDDAQYAAPDASSMPLPPEDGEPDAEIIGNELQINHHHGASAVPGPSAPDPTELEIKNQA